MLIRAATAIALAFVLTACAAGPESSVSEQAVAPYPVGSPPALRPAGTDPASSGAAGQASRGAAPPLVSAAVRSSAQAPETGEVPRVAGSSQSGDWTATLGVYRTMAEQGQATAQYELGRMYEIGLGVKPDRSAAADWYREAAGQDYAPAVAALNRLENTAVPKPRIAQAPATPENVAVPESATTSKSMAETAPVQQASAPAEQPAEEAKTGGALSGIYDLFLKPQPAIAPGLADPAPPAAAASTEPASAPEPRPNAYHVLLREQGTDASGDYSDGMAAYNSGDFELAFRNWLPLAEKGDAESQTRIGFLYEKGRGVPQDYQKAVQWYTAAAEQADPTGAFNLAVMYRKGQGVAASNVEARRWYQVAAENGHPFAPRVLALMDERGLGTDGSQTRTN